jgi:hypothetical protein
VARALVVVVVVVIVVVVVLLVLTFVVANVLDDVVSRVDRPVLDKLPRGGALVSLVVD